LFADSECVGHQELLASHANPMKTINEDRIAAVVAHLDELRREYPAGPCERALLTIRHLKNARLRLMQRAKENSETPPARRQAARKRRKSPKHPHGTPAHIRVLANIEVELETGCWIWLGSGTDHHGMISTETRKNEYVHRVMYEHANEMKLKPGDVVRHNCDNGFCCNPEHLLLGTQKENAQDRSQRQRGGVQKLTQADAKDILIRRREGESPSVLAVEYGMSVVGIAHVGRNSFKHLNDDPDVKAVRASFQGTRKLTQENVREIKRRLAEGDDHSAIATCFGVSVEYVGDIARGRRWSSVD
jgi:hypothetical protein